ncbi:MAG: hypothetical protein Ct9H90mV3_130 [uncultured marine virus]|nr:MAG: hypothetical protein Ct9H90mV3_130 [uncultured marine virus]
MILPCPYQVDRPHLEVQIQLLLPKIPQTLLVQQPLMETLTEPRVFKLPILILMEIRILLHAVKMEMILIGMIMMGLVIILKDRSMET